MLQSLQRVKLISQLQHIVAADPIAVLPHCNVLQTAGRVVPLFTTSEPAVMKTPEEVIAYKNEDITSRFTDLLEVSENEAEEIFIETRKFLYLSLQPGIFIPDELLILDEMWHNFILFTRVYQEFCLDYFGVYLHHIPASKQEKQLHHLAVLQDPQSARRNFENKLTKLISVTYDQFGAATVQKWFQEYPEKYSQENIKALRKN